MGPTAKPERGNAATLLNTRFRGLEKGLEALKVDVMSNGTGRERQNGGWRHRKGNRNMTKGKYRRTTRFGCGLVGMDLGHRGVCRVLSISISVNTGRTLCAGPTDQTKSVVGSRVLVGARCAEVLDVVICAVCVVCVSVCAALKRCDALQKRICPRGAV